MTRQTVWLIVILASLALIATMVLVYFFAGTANAGFPDAMAAVAFIAGAAVGIERTIEGLWTMLGGLLGSYWPLNVIDRQVKTLSGELDTSLKPFHERAIKKIEELKKTGNLTAEELKKLEDAPADIQRLKARFDELQKLAPGNQRVQLLAAAAAQNVNYLTKKYGDVLEDLNDAATVANSAIDGLQNFLATFKDNPGRRLISIYLGAILGLVLAGMFSLDVFNAAGVSTDAYPHARIILTGILIGLGSGPTHEVIRVIQEFKENRKGQNTKQPDLP
jgi:hypothetical protein